MAFYAIRPRRVRIPVPSPRSVGAGGVCSCFSLHGRVQSGPAGEAQELALAGFARGSRVDVSWPVGKGQLSFPERPAADGNQYRLIAREANRRGTATPRSIDIGESRGGRGLSQLSYSATQAEANVMQV